MTSWLAALAIIGIALFQLMRLRVLEKNGVSVTIKRTKNAVDWGPYVPLPSQFEIVSGENKGIIGKSRFGSKYSTGSIVQGIYNPQNGVIESLGTIKVFKFYFTLGLLGAIIFLVWKIIKPQFS